MNADLVGKKDGKEIIVRNELKPGDIGYLLYLHGLWYAREYSHGILFEAYVAEALLDFVRAYDRKRDVVWIAESQDEIVGSLFLQHRASNAAQLRFFFLLPEYRGIGIGGRLMDMFESELRNRSYSSAFLWTTSEQIAAVSLYVKCGFRAVEEKKSLVFGQPKMEQKYIKEIPKIFPL